MGGSIDRGNSRWLCANLATIKETVIFPSPAGFAITDGVLLEALGCTSLGIWKPRDLSQPSVFLSTYEELPQDRRRFSG